MITIIDGRGRAHDVPREIYAQGGAATEAWLAAQTDDSEPRGRPKRARKDDSE